MGTDSFNRLLVAPYTYIKQKNIECMLQEMKYTIPLLLRRRMQPMLTLALHLQYFLQESFSLLLYIFIFALHHPFLDSLHFLSWSLIERMHNAHQYYIYSFASLFLIYLVNHYLSVILTKCFNSIASSSTPSVHHTTSGSFSQQLIVELLDHFQRQNHNSVVG